MAIEVNSCVKDPLTHRYGFVKPRIVDRERHLSLVIEEKWDFKYSRAVKFKLHIMAKSYGF